MPSAKMLCEDCQKEKKKKEDLGFTATCTPVDGEPGFCLLTWFLPAADTTTTKKKPGKKSP